MEPTGQALDRAHAHAVTWLESLNTRDIPAHAGIEAIADLLGRTLPDGPTPAHEVIDRLATACASGLTGMPSGRFFGFVVGGTHPAALGADWLTSAWDQNAGMRSVTPAHSAVEELTGEWLVDLLDLPEGTTIGFPTGGTMANFTGLATGRDEVLRRAGWDLAARGLAGSPGVRVLVGADRHDTVDLTLRYLGLGQPELVAADRQGRLVPASLASALESGDGRPTIVVLQAGNLHSGAFDPFAEVIPLAHEHGAWVHVDGAFGLFAAATPAYRYLVEGYAEADSWATDAHKTLNVPYDCGVIAVRDPAALRSAMGMHGAYLIRDDAGEPFEKVPELSRRGRAFPVWAVLRALGRGGVADLVGRMAGHAARFAEEIAAIPGAELMHDVVFTQVTVSFGDDERTQRVVRRMLADGTAWTTGSRWQGRSVLRISVSNWSTTDDDVERTVAALRRAAMD